MMQSLGSSHVQTIFLHLLFFCAAGALLAGCGKNLEDSPLIREQVQMVSNLEEDTKANRRQLDILNDEITEMKRLLRGVKNLPAGGSKQLIVIDRRLDAIEKALANPSRRISATSAKADIQPVGMKNRAVKAKAPIPKNVKTAELRNPTPDKTMTLVTKSSDGKQPAGGALKPSIKKPAPQPASPATVDRKAKTSVKVLARSPAPRKSPEPSRAPTGFYYTVRNGDTASHIAKNNGISIEALLQANRIPVGKQLLAGNRIYVPSKK